MGVTEVARQMKHRSFVAYKRVRWPMYEVSEPLVRWLRSRRPYVYDPNEFADTFVVNDIAPRRGSTGPVPRVIYCFWTGDNDLPDIRLRSLNSMREMNPDLDVVLVTQDNLPRYVLDDEPLHPAYEGLSYVHRADYLRSYFLTFHGGGYADIKPMRNGWSQAFDRMEASDAWLMGYRNPSRLMTPNFADKRMERLMVKHSHLRLGQCAYIARPRTPIVEEWWREINRSLSRVQDQLLSSPGPIRSESIVPDYPLGWNQILAQILDPLTLKYSERIAYEPSLCYDTSRRYVD